MLEIIETARSKRARFRDQQITLAHGAGGKATQTLIEGLLVPAFDNGVLASLGDAGVVALGDTRLAMTSDSFVVKPLRFPGGSIGELAVNGTVNDLAMSGARPLALTVSMILEEGLDADVLRAEVEAIARAARAAGVEIVGGDTKVVERGAADGMYLCTTGVGAVDPRAELSTDGDPAGRPRARVGADRRARDGDHARARPVRPRRRDRVGHVLAVAGGRRAARGRRRPSCTACATPPAAGSPRCSTSSRVHRVSSVVVREADVPVSPVVSAAAELLGIDPMYVANEGRLVAFVAPEAADAALAALRQVSRLRAGGRDRRGARPSRPGMVLVETAFGGRRVMDQLVGDPLPRIC